MGRLRRLVCALSLGASLVWAACSDSTGPDPCNAADSYIIGATATGSLSSTDCALDDESFVDLYGFSSPTQFSARFTLTSSSFDAALLLLQGNLPDAPIIALNNNENSSTNSALHVIAAAGTYFVGANSFFAGETGSYVLSSTSVPEAVENCSEVWVTPGIAIAQTIEATDCIDTVGGLTFYADDYALFLFEGESVTITMTSTAVDAFLELRDADGSLIDDDDDSAGGTNARIVYTVTASDIYVVTASTNFSEETGAYALTVN